MEESIPKALLHPAPRNARSSYERTRMAYLKSDNGGSSSVLFFFQAFVFSAESSAKRNRRLGRARNVLHGCSSEEQSVAVVTSN